MPSTPRFEIWRGEPGGDAARSRTIATDGLRRHGRARRRAPDPGRTGARPRRALELQGRQVRLVLGRDQRQAAADVHDAAEHARSARAGDRRADARVPADQGPRHRRLVELPRQEERSSSSSRASPTRADGTWRMAQEDIDRVQEFRKCIECFLCQDVCHVLRDHDKHDEFIGPRFFVYAAALEMHPLDTDDRVARSEGRSTASATATSPSAARRSARSTSRSPTTRSFR